MSGLFEIIEVINRIEIIIEGYKQRFILKVIIMNGEIKINWFTHEVMKALLWLWALNLFLLRLWLGNCNK